MKENFYSIQCHCSTQAVNQAGAGPYSELVTCRIPASVPDAVSTLFVLEDEHVDACQLSPSVCLALNWEEPCNNGAEITSYNIDLGDISIPVGNVTSYVIHDLLPETSYRWVQFFVVFIQDEITWFNSTWEMFMACRGSRKKPNETRNLQ